MRQLFEIRFDFPLAYSDLTIALKAIAEIHNSETYYRVDNFHFEASKSGKNGLSILPVQEIKQARRGESRIWVHKDSERESLLSIAIGKAIEGALKSR
ncbi:MAG TPA: hypothetical protein VI461_17545 [Chitinophagaceae bacterium]|nr:hypothetical protein [Chitinophagaceae bacterium]